MDKKLIRSELPGRELPSFVAPTNGCLSEQILDAFHDVGVIVLRDYVPVEACTALKGHALKLVNDIDPHEIRSIFSTTSQTQLDDSYFIESGDKIRFFLEEEAFDDTGMLKQPVESSLNKIGHAMHDLDPVFDRFSRTPKLAETVRCLGFQDPAIIQSMYIFKPPKIGGEVVCHQDSTYIYTEPESCIGFWFALEDADSENGCMHFIPGGHKTPLKQRNYRMAKNRLAFGVYDEQPWPEHLKVAAEAKAGTLVVFHGRAPHLSGPNHSDTSRHAYTLHVIDQNCRYPGDNWLQRNPEFPLRGFS